MTKKLLCLLLAAFMLITVLAGCSSTEEVIYEDDDSSYADEEGDTDTSKTKRTKSTAAGKTTTGKQQGSNVTRPSRNQADKIKFTPVADSSANYKVKGEVSIAVDTVRPTDYDAMFDILAELYPDIEFKFDYWTHSTNDDGREYLIKNMATKTCANIMWDEAGEIPTYIMNGGWIKPITKYVAKDSEAKYIPANLKSDYTYFGELFALPHQATFEMVAFNTKLWDEIGLKQSDFPKLEWSLDQYAALLKKGADNGWSKNKCVAIQDLFEAYNRVSYLKATANGGNYGVRAYNYKTQQYEVKYLKEGALQFRAWRVYLGTEGWYHRDEVKSKFGVSGYSGLWGAGKALMDDCGSWQVEQWDDQYPNLKFKAWTAPNTKGKLMMHIDQCFITSTTPDSKMDACYQVLRFMTFTTNGNLARLTMYKDDASAGNYNLNSHVYYPTTTSPTVIKTFNDLKCTNEVDEYMVANIKNSCRYDTFKVVPGLRTADGEWGNAMNDITDGLDPSGAGLDEPATKVNAELKKFQQELEAAYEKYYQ